MAGPGCCTGLRVVSLLGSRSLSNFAPLAWLDTFALAASLPRREGLFRAEPERPGLRHLAIRGLRKDTLEEDEDFVGYKAATNWPELKNLLGRIQRLGDLGGGVELGRVFLMMLDAGAMQDWRREASPYFERWSRALVAVRSNPGVVMVIGAEAFQPGPGILNVVSVRLPHTMANFGETPAIMLAVDFRRKADADQA